MKKNLLLAKLLIAIMPAATLCACFKPAAPVETPVEVVEETVVEEPSPVVEKPEVEEPETPDPEVIKEESNEPELVLYDDKGDFYVPQKVTLDEFYARIDYANQKYTWKSDWDRDRYIGLLLYDNAYAMEDADIKTIYYDYLDNFGIDVLDGQFNCCLQIQEGHTADDHYYDHNLIDLEDLFIDAKFVNEAKKFQPIIKDNKVRIQFTDGNKQFVESLDYSNKDMYNILFEQEMSYIMYSYDTNVVDGIFDNNYAISESKQKVWDQINIDDEMLEGYDVSKYESSHVDE